MVKDEPLTHSAKHSRLMKTTGQDADPKPGRECSTCGAPLGKDEYELCDPCRERLEKDYAQRQSRPKARTDRW